MTDSSIYLAASDYAIVVFYFAITISLGLHFSRRWKGSEDFFLAGRSLTWPLIGLSLFATNTSVKIPPAGNAGCPLPVQL
jgi:SSS family solute:Na+ symporter